MVMRLMEPGQRDRIVTLEERSATDAKSTSQFPKETWTTLVEEMPAGKEDVGAKELFRSGQLAARVDTRWEINYRADMDPELLDVPKLRRVVHRGRVHDIVSASVIGRRDGIELLTMASTRVS